MERTFNKRALYITSRRSLPLYRSINSLAVLARYVSMKGIDVALLLAGSKIQPSDLDDPDVLVTPEQELTVMRNIVRLVPEPGLGLSIGRQSHMGIIGKLGAAAINSNTFLDAIRIIFQYSELLLTYFHFDLKVKDDLVFITLKELVDLKDIRLFVCEREFASIHRIASDLIGAHFPVNEMRFAYPRPRHASLYQDIFKCSLVFNAEVHSAIFDRKYLFQELPLADPLVRKTYEKECRQLSLRINRQGTMTRRIHQEILFQRDGFPGFDQLARYVNLSPRTLSRRLTAEGTSYKDIISRIRKTKAINLLKMTDYSIEQIATELGYSDLSNFYRAFKSWTGHNPGYYRKKN
ncbi:MAG TPA: AraC family transcriptional regulator [Deltaproteobacteria bacterium]|nr:AraC family transcriptional regulator [Deltaproteobacteria bacterium]